MTKKNESPERSGAEIQLQPASYDIWEQKYQLKDNAGTPIDLSPEDTFRRVASALAAGEKDREHWEGMFLEAMRSGAYPGGRIIANAGAGEHKPSASLINCTVMPEIPDSMDGIMTVLHKAALTLKAGCGTGYCFSTLRPKGAYVSGAGATTSGPLPFMDIFDKMCQTVSSAGGRRGAQMGTFSVEHPDVVDFIRAKREDGKLRNFNLSILVTEVFIECVKQDTLWTFRFPASAKDQKMFPEECFTGIDGKVYRKYGQIPARELWDMIMRSTYDYSEPGVMFVDAMNKQNPLHFMENIIASNPCGEIGAPGYGSCLLGSINLTSFIRNPFQSNFGYFDFKKFAEVVQTFTRMLDNVVEIANLPLEELSREMVSKRRHGMGFFGLGSAMTMLGMEYGSPESIRFLDSIMAEMVVNGYEAGLQIAKEKGCCLALVEKDNIKKFLESPYISGIRKNLKKFPTLSTRFEAVLKQIPEYGLRFTHHTAIAPTGTLALSLGNNASNGIEPSFAHQYSRNIIRQGRKTKEKVEVLSFELLAFRKLLDPRVVPADLPKSFISADSISPKAHVDVQAAAQKWIDSSISKTINVPADIPYEEFKEIYMYGAGMGLKGCTTFRFNPQAFQGVLVKDEDLKKTTYQFTLDDGSVVSARGDEMIEYDGGVHTAANLFDAMKEGMYGKF